jgi:hypothetical protein
MQPNLHTKDMKLTKLLLNVIESLFTTYYALIYRCRERTLKFYGTILY